MKKKVVVLLLVSLILAACGCISEKGKFTSSSANKTKIMAINATSITLRDSGLYPNEVAAIKNELKSRGMAAQVAHVKNSPGFFPRFPAFIILVDVTDGDYFMAAREAIIAAANHSIAHPTVLSDDAIIILIGPDKVYRFEIPQENMDGIRYAYDIMGDTGSNKIAKVYLDSAIVSTPQEFMASLGVH